MTRIKGALKSSKRSDNRMRGQLWTSEMDQQLRSLYKRNLSCSMIANEMDCGLTRNAIIGRASRLGLGPRGAGKHPKIEKQRPLRILPGRIPSFRVTGGRLRPTPMVQPMEPPRCIEITSQHVSMIDLSHNGCRYPVNEIFPFLFCNHRQIEGSSYCGLHFQLSIGPGSFSERRASQMVNA